MTNLDVLRGMGPLRVARAYHLHGDPRAERVQFPLFDLDDVRPVFEEHQGFDEDLSGMRHWSELPPAARRYVEAVEARLGVPIRTVSVGPGRDQVIRRESVATPVPAERRRQAQDHSE